MVVSTYQDQYRIVQTFKENAMQKVYIGTDNKNNQAVVINVIDIEEDDFSWRALEYTYQNVFQHVLHFEKTEDKVILVTKVEEGISLNAYLNDFSPSFKERTSLIHQYLKEIRRYGGLPNNLQAQLVNESQLTVNEGSIAFDELLIFDHPLQDLDTFDRVLQNIVSVLKKLTTLQSVTYEELPLYIEVMGFLDDLQKNNAFYSSISDVFSKFETLNIPLSEISIQKGRLEGLQNISRSNSLVGRKVGSIEEETIEAMESPKKITPTIALVTAGLVLTMFLGFFLLKDILPLDLDLPVDANKNSSKVTETQNLEEVKAAEDASFENSEEDPVGPSDEVSFLSEHVEKDFSSAKYGDYSFKISGENSSSHKLIINSGHTKANAQLLMWLKLDSPDEIKIRVEGYSKDNRTFQQSIQHKPLRTHSWELVQLTLDGEISDAVHILFDDVDGLVWIDKISIDVFK